MATPAVLDMQFNWQPQPRAWKLINSLVAEFKKKNLWAVNFSSHLRGETGTRFVDWIDHIVMPEDCFGSKKSLTGMLTDAGFKHEPQPNAKNCYLNRDGLFPPVIVGDNKGHWLIALKVESVVEFLQMNNLPNMDSIEGEALSRLRMALAAREEGTELCVIERHGLWGFDFCGATAQQRIAAQEHLGRFRTRRRDFYSDEDAFIYTSKLVDEAIKDLGEGGKDWACDLFFKAEREFWQKRNRAAQVQYARQQKLGLGWANHDHHTYRCDRATFKEHVGLLEKLGLVCRERFYAGAEAGWGAQVMESPVTGITTFNDVDMSPEEVLGDFAHEGFREKQAQLGTVGLWCALHGQALFQAGMHHLECQFDHEALVLQLEHRANVKTMAPFTTFPYLRQAFTEGERWAVDHKRIDALLARGQINKSQAEMFKVEGAVGSHMENLERNDGFKGFNQQGVSDIIARTDPRKLAKMKQTVVLSGA
jgi:hypothetical protein